MTRLMETASTRTATTICSRWNKAPKRTAQIQVASSTQDSRICAAYNLRMEITSKASSRMASQMGRVLCSTSNL